MSGFLELWPEVVLLSRGDIDAVCGEEGTKERTHAFIFVLLYVLTGFIEERTERTDVVMLFKFNWSLSLWSILKYGSYISGHPS